MIIAFNIKNYLFQELFIAYSWREIRVKWYNENTLHLSIIWEYFEGSF